MAPNFEPLIVSGIFLGMGLGALLIDGILLHQLLQVHNMVSGWYYPDTLEKARFNMFFDGIFHVMTWIMTVIGLVLLWIALGQKNVPRSARALIGSMIFGFGLFNLIEGIIDHHLLGIHHVVELAPQPTRLYWDLAFLLFGGALLITVGGVQVYQARIEIEKI